MNWDFSDADESGSLLESRDALDATSFVWKMNWSKIPNDPTVERNVKENFLLKLGRDTGLKVKKTMLESIGKREGDITLWDLFQVGFGGSSLFAFQLRK